MYNLELKKARNKGFYDVIFQNEKNEITEGAISNILLKQNNHYLTPTLSSGLLNGVYRQYLFSEKTEEIKEKILTIHDLKKADEIYLCNSVRKLVQVSFLY